MHEVIKVWFFGPCNLRFARLNELSLIISFSWSNNNNCLWRFALPRLFLPFALSRPFIRPPFQNLLYQSNDDSSQTPQIAKRMKRLASDMKGKGEGVNIRMTREQIESRER